MSDTIPDISVDKDLYSDVNDLSGIAAGTAIIVENKTTIPVRLQISLTQPLATSVDGSIIYKGGKENSIKLVTAGESTVWAKALGSTDAILSVQENL